MKKFLSALLALSMVLSACFLIASCSPAANDGNDGNNDKDNKNPVVGTEVSLDEIKNNTTLALATVMNNTINQFFGAPDTSDQVLVSAIDGGSIQFLFESDLLGDLSKISETVYMNGKDTKFVSDTVLTYAGEDLAARIFVDKNGFMLNSPTVLGSDKTLALNIESFFDNFSSSVLAEVLLGGETPAEYEEMFAQIKDMLKNFSFPTIELDPSVVEKVQELYAAVKMTVTEEKVDGVDCIVVTYTIDNETIKELVNKLIDLLVEEGKKMMSSMMSSLGDYLPVSPDEMIDQALAGLGAGLEDAFVAMDATLDIDISIKLNINKATFSYDSIVIDGTVANPQAEEGDSLDNTGVVTGFDIVGKASFGSDKISFTGDILIEGKEDNALGCDIVLNKEEKNNEVNYDLTVGASLKDRGELLFDGDLIHATFNYNRENGNFVYSAEVCTDFDGGESFIFILEGKYIATNESVTFEINGVTIDSISVRFRFAVIINAKADMPEFPADAMDVVELTEGEILDIMNEIQSSPLVEFINSMMPEEDYTEPEYDWEYDYYAA